MIFLIMIVNVFKKININFEKLKKKIGCAKISTVIYPHFYDIVLCLENNYTPPISLFIS